MDLFVLSPAALFCAAIVLAGVLAAVSESADGAVPRDIYSRARAFQRRRIPPERFGRTRLVREVAGVSLRENDEFWVLKGRELIATIDKKTGLISAITSLQPRRRDLLAPTRNGLLCYLWNRSRSEFDIANKLTGHAIQRGRREGQPYLGLSVNLAFSQPFAADAVGVKATYRMSADRLDICFHLDYLRTNPDQWEAGVFQAYDPRPWQRQIVVEVGRTTRALKPREKALERYADFPSDATAAAPDALMRRSRYPYVILEGDDRLFLWGYMDLNSFAVLTPNRLGGLPSFSIAPTGIKQGESYSFDFTYKVLPKPRHELADMCRWYAENLYSSNPLTAGIVRLPKKVRPQVLSEGNVLIGWYAPCEVGQEEKHARLQSEARKVKGVHLWYGGWNPWNEDHPTSGRWYVGGGLWQTAEGVKNEIQELRRNGFEVYTYFRQIRHDVSYYDDRPPYRDWIHLTEGGFPWNFTFTGTPSPDAPRTPISPEDRQAFGVEAADYTDVFMDLCNDDCRKWLTAEFIAALDYFQPSGIAWDMGWGDILGAPCCRHPHAGLHHAVMRIVYDVHQWVKKHHPWMKIIGNEFKGSPPQMYCDGMMFESGDHIDTLAMQSVKFYRTAATTLCYKEVYPDEQWTPTVMRHLSLGIAWGGRAEEMAQPPFDKLGALADFSARVNNTPMVIERAGLALTPARDQVTGAAWANKARLQVAIFNDLKRATTVRADLDRRVLRTYGQPGAVDLGFTVLSNTGAPRPDSTWKARLAGPNRLSLAGKLGAKEMLLAERQRP
jgi:hypothetical protein